MRSLINFAPCIHCGQMIDTDTGADAGGNQVCGKFSADPDMYNELHDWDWGYNA